MCDDSTALRQGILQGGEQTSQMGGLIANQTNGPSLFFICLPESSIQLRNILKPTKTSKNFHSCYTVPSGDYSLLYADLQGWAQNKNFSINKEQLDRILKLLPKKLTILCEDYYIDRLFRNSFYYYYSSKHFNVDRVCKRLSFFLDESFSIDEYFSETNGQRFQQIFAGFIVLQPISLGFIGRSLFDPTKLKIPESFMILPPFSRGG